MILLLCKPRGRVGMEEVYATVYHIIGIVLTFARAFCRA